MTRKRKDKATRVFEFFVFLIDVFAGMFFTLLLVSVVFPQVKPLIWVSIYGIILAFVGAMMTFAYIVFRHPSEKKNWV